MLHLIAVLMAYKNVYYTHPPETSNHCGGSPHAGTPAPQSRINAPWPALLHH